MPAVDGGGPTSALVARLHHCLADGIALASVLLSLTDDEPRTPPVEVDRPDGTGRDPRVRA